MMDQRGESAVQESSCSAMDKVALRGHTSLTHPRRLSEDSSLSEDEQGQPSPPTLPLIKVESIKTELVDHGGDLDFNEYVNSVNEKDFQSYEVPPHHHQNQESLWASSADDDAIDSKPELVFVVGQGRYVCRICSKCLVGEDLLYDHLYNDCGKQLEIKCIHCSFRSEFLDDMRSHITLKHQDLRLDSDYEETQNPVPEVCDLPVCGRCGETFNTPITEHLDNCEGIKKHKCPLCFYETKWKEQLTQHLTKAHSIGAIESSTTCIGCKKKFKNEKRLEKHLQFCVKLDPNRKFVCFHCSREVKLKKSLRRHIRVVHPVDALARSTCPRCGNSYKQQDDLRQHMKRYCGKSNIDIVIHKCTLCKYETNRRANLMRHIERMHLIGEKDCHVCSRCGNIYNDGLEEHMKHCGEMEIEIVKHKCQYCDYETSGKYDLAKHMETMHSAAKNSGETDCKVCPHCGRYFKSLRQHVLHCAKSGTEIAKYKCPYCNYETIWKYNLGKHVKKLHPESD